MGRPARAAAGRADPPRRPHSRGQPRRVRGLAGPRGRRHTGQGRLRGRAGPRRAVGGRGAAHPAVGAPAADQRGRSAEHRQARPARRGRRDQPVELPADPVDPRGRPGARPRQRGHPQAGRADRGLRRHPARPAVRAGRAPRRPAARAARRRRTRCRAGREPGRGDDLVHRLDRGRPAGRRGRRADAEARQPGARRQQRAHRARRRRYRRRQLGRRVERVPAPGPGLHDRGPAHRARSRGR